VSSILPLSTGWHKAAGSPLRQLEHLARDSCSVFGGDRAGGRWKAGQPGPCARHARPPLSAFPYTSAVTVEDYRRSDNPNLPSATTAARRSLGQQTEPFRTCPGRSQRHRRVSLRAKSSLLVPKNS